MKCTSSPCVVLQRAQPRDRTQGALEGALEPHPSPYMPHPAAVPDLTSQKTQMGLPIVSDEALLHQLFHRFRGLPIGGPGAQTHQKEVIVLMGSGEEGAGPRSSHV